jgi:hypothetical protein
MQLMFTFLETVFALSQNYWLGRQLDNLYTVLHASCTLHRECCLSIGFLESPTYEFKM